ncbi:MAG TPA: hypothetical protein VES19_05280 [Candidatus Limnocylindrales bacterium]|nr:hypothetical protein [Candidatus Limnocylindrales bacterium]
MRRAWLVTTAIVLVAAGGVLALNVAGGVLIPVGPLGDHRPIGPDVAVSTLNYQPQRESLYLTPLVENTGPLPATVVRVTPTGVTAPGSVEILGSLPFDLDDPAQRGADGMSAIAIGIQEDPGPAWAHPGPVDGATVLPHDTSPNSGRAFLVRFTPDPGTESVVLGFDVEYTIGPLRFLTTAWGPVGTTVIVCGRDRPVANDGCQER